MMEGEWERGEERIGGDRRGGHVCYQYNRWYLIAITSFYLIGLYFNWCNHTRHQLILESTSATLNHKKIIYVYIGYHSKLKIIFNIFTYLDSDRTSERGYDILLQQYIVTWEEANKNRMFLPSRGTSGNGEYGVCEDKNEVIISSNLLMNLNTMFSRSFCSHVMFSCGKWE